MKIKVKVLSENYVIDNKKNKFYIQGENKTGYTFYELKDCYIELTGFYSGLNFQYNSIELLEDDLFMALILDIGEFKYEGLREAINEYTSESILEWLKYEDIKSLTQIKGVGEKTVIKIIEKWKESKDILFLIKSLLQYDITHSILKKIIKNNIIDTKYLASDYSINQTTIDFIKKNPYKLLKSSKMIEENSYVTPIKLSYKEIDKFALSLNISIIDEERIYYAIIDSLYLIANNGDTLVSEYSLISETFKTLSYNIKKNIHKSLLSKEIILNYLEKLNNNEMIKKININEKREYALTLNYDIENFIFKYLYSKSLYDNKNIVSDINQFILDVEDESGYKLDTQQKKALINCNKNSDLFILSGYAGTGKSTISKYILELFSVLYKNIYVTAVSGIATDRIKTTTGQNGSTIVGFLSSEIDALDVILIDEMSMVNVTLFKALLNKIYLLEKKFNKKIKIVLVGDDAQLPPIGGGDIFKNILHSKLFAYSELNNVHRAEDGNVINKFAKKIRTGLIPAYKNKNKGFEFYDTDSNDLIEKLMYHYKLENDILNKYLKDQDYQSYIEHLQILVPMKNNTHGVLNINNEIQKRYNNNKYLRCNSKIFKLYDKVIHIKNTLMDTSSYYSKSKHSKKIYNGFIGIIDNIKFTKINGNYKAVSLTVNYPKEKIRVEYNLDKAYQYLQLGYAITIHKSQGSEYKKSLIPLSNQHYYMMKNNLLYTAVTRSKQSLSIIGNGSIFERAIKTFNDKNRMTIFNYIISYFKSNDYNKEKFCNLKYENMSNDIYSSPFIDIYLIVLIKKYKIFNKIDDTQLEEIAYQISNQNSLIYILNTINNKIINNTIYTHLLKYMYVADMNSIDYKRVQFKNNIVVIGKYLLLKNNKMIRKLDLLNIGNYLRSVDFKNEFKNEYSEIKKSISLFMLSSEYKIIIERLKNI